MRREGLEYFQRKGFVAAYDLIFGHSGGLPPQNKQEFFAFAKNSDYEALPLRDIRIRVYGQTAVLSSFLDTKHTESPTDPVKALQVFRKINGQWQLAAFQSARLNARDHEERISVGGSSGEIKAVEEAATGWTRAMAHKDKAELERLLSPDLIFVHSNGSTIQNQAQYLAASERARYEALPLRNIQTRIYGETAVLTAHIDTKNVGRDPFRVRTIQIFVKKNRRWQLAAFQSTRLTSGRPTQ